MGRRRGTYFFGVMRPLALVVAVGCIVGSAVVGWPSDVLRVVSAPLGSDQVASVVLRDARAGDAGAPEPSPEQGPAVSQSDDTVAAGGGDGGGGGSGVLGGPAGGAGPGGAPGGGGAGTGVVTTDPGDPSGTSPLRGVPLVVRSNGYVANGTVAIDVDPAAVAGAEPSEIVLERALATLSEGACAGYGSWARTTQSQAVPDGSCARYRVRVVASDGSEVVFISPNVVRRDDSAPTEPVVTITEDEPDEHVAGSVLYYNPKPGNAGSFTVNATSEDPQSGLVALTLPALFGSEQVVTPEKVVQITYAWGEGAGAPGAQTVVAKNGADGVSTAVFNVLPDADGPGGGSVSYPDGTVTTGSVPIAVDPGTDALSGVDPGTGALEKRTGLLTPQRSCQLGEWTAAASPDSLPQGPACVQYRYRISDNVGNETIYASNDVVEIPDTTPPTGSIVSPEAGSWVHGVVEVSADASDEGSGVARVVFEAAVAGTGEWTEIGTATGSPWQVGWDTTALADGQYDLRATTFDGFDNSSSSAVVTVGVDNGAPEGKIRVRRFLHGVVPVAAEGSDAASGVASLEIQLAPAGGGWQTIASGEGSELVAKLDTTTLENGFYVFRAIVRDQAGNEGVSSEVRAFVKNRKSCAEDEERNEDGECVPVEECPENAARSEDGDCVPPPECPEGAARSADGECEPADVEEPCEAEAAGKGQTGCEGDGGEGHPPAEEPPAEDDRCEGDEPSGEPEDPPATDEEHEEQPEEQPAEPEQRATEPEELPEEQPADAVPPADEEATTAPADEASAPPSDAAPADAPPPGV
jgi:hypothetical protein